MDSFFDIQPDEIKKHHNFHVVSHHDMAHLQGPYFPIEKVTIQALPKNKGVVWISRGEPASDQNGLPLYPGDTTMVDCPNLSEIFLFFKYGWDKVLIWVSDTAAVAALEPS